MKVTLTFDNGPEPGVTDRVLEVLKSEGIAATFFVLGTKLADPARRALTVRAHAEGHWIGNHTMTHDVPLGNIREAGKARSEILETQKLIGGLSHPDRLFRPFGGGGALGPHLLNSEALEVLKEERMTCVLWNAVPRDFADPHTLFGPRPTTPPPPPRGPLPPPPPPRGAPLSPRALPPSRRAGAPPRPRPSRRGGGRPAAAGGCAGRGPRGPPPPGGGR